ncbi:MAG: hypothetical protein KJT03_19585, partial [Verrucomicrobiae bacterium]|nr:hypothetical protein [Verrucomicrobiae bacterium]
DHHESGRTMEGLLAIQLHRGNPNKVYIKDLRIRPLKDGKIIPFSIPSDAQKIDKPRTQNPQGVGPVVSPKKN